MTDDLTGTVTCPKCKHQQKMTIPTKSCVPFYECEGCKETISAETKCCVFCDYGDKACPVSHEA